MVSGRPGHLNATWEVAVVSSCSAFWFLLSKLTDSP